MNADRNPVESIAEALEIAHAGSFDGAHHKMWVIDQMVRALTDCPWETRTALDAHDAEYTFQAYGESDAYRAFTSEHDEWDIGIAP